MKGQGLFLFLYGVEPWILEQWDLREHLFDKECETCNLEMDITKIIVQGQLRQKKTIFSTSKLRIVVHACNPSYMGGAGSGTAV
jgi:hypothetical protein